MLRLVLLASPLLGPTVWMPVADMLRARGRLVSVAPSPGAVRTPEDVLAAWLPQLPEDEDVVLVPHSNAGLYVAALAAARTVTGVIFVDAGLPGDGGATPTAPAGLRAMLAGLADAEGLLPPWTKWWPDEDLDGLFPDAATRAAVEAEQVRLPLGYFDEQVRSPSGWDERAAYLAFGDTYADEQAEARRRGWPLEVLPGRHLHQLVDPVAVADAVLRLEAATGTGARATDIP